MCGRGTASTPEARGDSGGVENKDEACLGVFSREKMVPGKHAYPTIRRMKVSRRKGRGCFTLDIVRSRPYLHACTISSGSGIIFITEPPRREFCSSLKRFKRGKDDEGRPSGVGPAASSPCLRGSGARRSVAYRFPARWNGGWRVEIREPSGRSVCKRGRLVLLWLPRLSACFCTRSCSSVSPDLPYFQTSSVFPTY